MILICKGEPQVPQSAVAVQRVGDGEDGSQGFELRVAGGDAYFTRCGLRNLGSGDPSIPSDTRDSPLRDHS